MAHNFLLLLRFMAVSNWPRTELAEELNYYKGRCWCNN